MRNRCSDLFIFSACTSRSKNLEFNCNFGYKANLYQLQIEKKKTTLEFSNQLA